MELVSQRQELLENLRTLARYKDSDNPLEARFYSELMRNGICFTVYESVGEVLWGPSRFVGYNHNSMTAHKANDSKDGKELTQQ